MAPSAGSPPSTAGAVLWRLRSGVRAARHPDDVDILVVHPGGPFWAKKDEHAWSIPKGEFDPAEETPLEAAAREFAEEMGEPLPPGDTVELTPFRAGRKRLHAFAIEADFDVTTISPDDTHRSMVELEWPPRSGQKQPFPEVDRAAWVPLSAVATKLHKGQAPLVAQLITHLIEREDERPPRP